MNTHNYIYYGTSTNAIELQRFIKHLLNVNTTAEAENRKKTPICIWGRHGIGKTEIVETIAKENGYKFAYIAPAQFEEMGDLIGMPKIVEGKTVFAPPEWVPKEEGPGILLIDDANRADDRILRGIMQLLQNYELISWKLPAKWHIILTANPDGGDYSVTPMDDAMLTRMMHITMQFDVKAWAKWAEIKDIDSRGINFILTYPEIVTGDRTTPRTLVQFFESISAIKNLEDELPMVQLLGDSCLDGNTVAAFISFVKNGLQKLISSEEIVNAKDFLKIKAYLRSVVVKDTLRVDIIATLCIRLVNYLSINKKKKLSKLQMDNVRNFLKLEFLPNDLRLTTLQELVSGPNKSLKMVVADPALGKLLLQKM